MTNDRNFCYFFKSEDLLDQQLEDYHQTSLDYVFQLYQLQEMKKFQFVEIVSKHFCNFCNLIITVNCNCLCIRNAYFDGNLKLLFLTKK